MPIALFINKEHYHLQGFYFAGDIYLILLYHFLFFTSIILFACYLSLVG